MMPGLIVLTRALSPADGSAIMCRELPRFDIWYACKESFHSQQAFDSDEC